LRRAMKLLLDVDGGQDLGVDYQVASPNNNSVGYPGILGKLWCCGAGGVGPRKAASATQAMMRGCAPG